MNYDDFCDLYFKVPHGFNLNRLDGDISIDNFYQYTGSIMIGGTKRFKSVLLLTDIIRMNYELQ